MKPQLVLLAGPNGAGKSTFYDVFLSESSLPFLNADLFAAETDLDSLEAADTDVRSSTSSSSTWPRTGRYRYFRHGHGSPGSPRMGSARLLAHFDPQFLAAHAVDARALTWGGFLLRNLLPVTIGNVIGGALLVGGVYWFVYLRPRPAD